MIKNEIWKVYKNVYRIHVAGKRLKNKAEKLFGSPVGEYYKSFKFLTRPSEWDFQFTNDKLEEAKNLIKEK